MEQRERSEEQFPQEVNMYLDRFDQVPPSEVLRYHHDLYSGMIMHDPIKTRLHQHFTRAMALYPERSQYTNPGAATELYTAFAASNDTNDTLRMLSIVTNLWKWEPQGATKVIKMCLRRPIHSDADQKVYWVACDITRRALLDQTWIDDESDPLGNLTVERIRRNLAPPGDGL
jgi:hypothetical protein